jgi:hypothetical protein
MYLSLTRSWAYWLLGLAARQIHVYLGLVRSSSLDPYVNGLNI